MSVKFQNKYRIESCRLQSWNYGSNASYFVTICIKDRLCHFGTVKNGTMTLSKEGTIANNIWNKIQEQFPYTRLENHVIMPNHMHGIIVIQKKTEQCDFVGTRLIAFLQNHPNDHRTGGITGQHNPMLHDNLGRIIRWYKGRVKYEIKGINPKNKSCNLIADTKDK